MDEFSKYAIKHRGISSTTLEKYKSIASNYISPTIIEERQLNIATMDVFSRLMMDRIIFLGVRSMIMLPILSRHSCFSSNPLIQGKISRST